MRGCHPFPGWTPFFVVLGIALLLIVIFDYMCPKEEKKMRWTIYTLDFDGVWQDARVVDSWEAVLEEVSRRCEKTGGKIAICPVVYGVM